MNKIISFILFFVVTVQYLSAQILPLDNSKLNYRLIGFSFPPVVAASGYTIQIADGNYNNEDSFKNNIICALPVNANKLITEVPAFGRQYTWRVMYSVNNETIGTKATDLHHFSTGIIPAVDTTRNRLRITTAAKKYKDAVVFLDALGVLYDMNGMPLWYLPSNSLINRDEVIRDMKLSPLGTITFLLGSKIFEINYNGDVLWKRSPEDIRNKQLGKINSFYHHEFTRLSNGHYMALGSEDVICKLPSAGDTAFLIGPGGGTDTNKNYRKIPFGTLVEYDENGNEV